MPEGLSLYLDFSTQIATVLLWAIRTDIDSLTLPRPNPSSTPHTPHCTRDVGPSLMQPFLLTSYYKICQERRMRLPEMFQWDLTWEPVGEEMESEETAERRGRGAVACRGWVSGRVISVG